jgi:hypothetical protein
VRSEAITLLGGAALHPATSCADGCAAVTILYNCPDGCPEIVQLLEELFPTLPLGPNTRSERPRALIFPYTEMDANVAAVWWGWLFERSDLNVDELRQFVERHLDRGAERASFRCP